MTSNPKPEHPCPTCGGHAYTWGSVSAAGLNFCPDDASALKKYFQFGTFLHGRRCDECGNLQLFTKPPRSDS